jgi:2-polyprenyl-3-methyl-5-hydroxy-6-metoxy-1,4-benzoquinol methylase
MSQVREQLQQFWDKRYSAPEFVYGTEPNQFLVDQLAHLPPGGRVLCLADGEGRNGVWLSRQGFEVTSVDVSPQGVGKMQRLAAQAGVALKAEVADVTTLELGLAQWDAIVSIFLHLPDRARVDLHQRAVLALRPGGVFVWQAYAPEQLKLSTGGPKDAALLPSLEVVARDFADCTMLHVWAGLHTVNEGCLHTGEGEVTQLLAKKPA